MSWDNQADKVWPDEEEEDMWFLMATPDDETSGKWTTFSNPSRFKGVPSLTAWIGGKDAIEAEKQSDEEILEDVMGNLRAMFPTISDPDNVIVTRWGQDENVLGAYSFPSPGQAYYEDQENIKRRLGKIYFAGEHTSGNGWGSVSGFASSLVLTTLSCSTDFLIYPLALRFARNVFFHFAGMRFAPSLQTFGSWDTGEEAAIEMAARIARLPEIEEELIVTTEPTEPVTTTEVPEPEPTTTEPAEIIVTTEEPARPLPFEPTETPGEGSDDFAIPDFGFGGASDADDEADTPDEDGDEFALPPGFGSAEGDEATEIPEQSEEEASESSDSTDPPTYAPIVKGPTYEGPGEDAIPEPLSSSGFLLSVLWTVHIASTLLTFL